MDPQWYFTSSELHDYMKFAVRRQWDIGEMGAKIEAFAVAGCDPASWYSNVFCVPKSLTGLLFETYSLTQSRSLTILKAKFVIGSMPC
jgi:hypothetical protein